MNELKLLKDYALEAEKKMGCENQSIADIGLHLFEEGGEVARCITLLTGTRIGHPEESGYNRKKLAEELGDVIFLVTRIANRCGMPLEDCLLQLQLKLFKRFGAVPYCTQAYILAKEEKELLDERVLISL